MAALAYLLTFNTYGSWLHGDERGSVDRRHNSVLQERLAQNLSLERRRRELMTDAAYCLDDARQRIVLQSIQSHVSVRQWQLWAAHIRPTHGHVVVGGDISPERMLNEFKSYASRALNATQIDSPDRHRWAKHGSTKYLFTEQSIVQAVNYVIDEQGDRTVYYDSRPQSEPRPQGSWPSYDHGGV